METMARSISFLLLLFAGLSAGLTVHAQPQSPPKKTVSGGDDPAAAFPIDSITVEGNRILPEKGIVAASGLSPGSSATGAAFDGARERLLATGYFETVACRYKPSGKGGGYEVSFEVQEIEPLFSIRIEALPLTASEAVAYLKAKDPLFTGRVPGTDQVLARTARGIEEYLTSQGRPQKVSGKIVSVGTQKFEAQFTPEGGLPNVSLVSFEGNKAVRDTDLQNAIAEVAFGQPYTDANFILLLDNQVRPLYEKNGYMRVVFRKITTTPSSQVKGLDVHVAIEEGSQYKLGEVGVRGPMEDQSKHILRVAKMSQMAIADFDKIRDAETRITQSLKHEGYLDVTVSVDKEISDEKKVVNVYFMPNPGPQYMFGDLKIEGLGLDGVNAVKTMWGVPSGEPFPAEYPDYFAKQVKAEGVFDNLGDVKAEPDIDAEKHIVNVTVTFRYEHASPRKKPDQPGSPL
jgi:outer membrane protein assembly factor BamA